MKKRIPVILIAAAIVIVSAGITAAALMWVVPKNNGNHSDTSKDQSPKKRADDASAKAKKLIDETTKMGSGKEADKKTQEAATLFEEASKLYKQAGDNASSYEAQANADSLRSRLAVEEPFKKQQEAEWAKQKAEIDAARAAARAATAQSGQ